MAEFAPEFVTIARVGDIPTGQGRAFPLQDRMVAIFFDGERYEAINDFCPHMGASLADGEVKDGIVTCPWHAWRFRLKDGTWCDNPRIATDAYDVRVSEGEIQVRVSAHP